MLVIAALIFGFIGVAYWFDRVLTPRQPEN